MTQTTTNTTGQSLFIPGITVTAFSISGQELANYTSFMMPVSKKSQFDCDYIMHSFNFLIKRSFQH